MRPFRFLAALLTGAAITLSAAAETASSARPASGFTTTLSEEAQAGTGLNKLSVDERAAINELVAHEISLARQGHVTGFAGTFVSRRTPEERKRAGLGRLTGQEQTKLNELVAATLAAGGSSTSASTRLKRTDLATRDRLQVHGEFSFTYGWGGGGTFRGGSLYTTVSDPQSGISLGVGHSQYSGNGWWWDDYCYPRYYSPARADFRGFRGGDFCVQ
jgi:hypothetical protein